MESRRSQENPLKLNIYMWSGLNMNLQILEIARSIYDLIDYAVIGTRTKGKTFQIGALMLMKIFFQETKRNFVNIPGKQD